MKGMKFTIVAVAAVLLAILYVGGLLARFYGTFPVWVGMATDIVATLTPLLLAFVAALGLDEWKDQFNIRNEHEIAKRILGVVHKLAWEMEECRGIRTKYEMHEFIQKFGFADDAKWEVISHTYNLMQLRNIGSELVGELMNVRAQVTWGDELAKKISVLLSCYHELARALREYNPNSKVRDEKIYNIIFAPDGDKDEFKERIDKSVTDIEEWLRLKLRL